MVQGGALRKPQRDYSDYTLLEVLADGTQSRESFAAPDPQEAILLAQDVIEGRKAELWRGDELVHAWG